VQKPFAGKLLNKGIITAQAINGGRRRGIPKGEIASPLTPLIDDGNEIIPCLGGISVKGHMRFTKHRHR
jgi:hypothetical protein